MLFKLILQVYFCDDRIYVERGWSNKYQKLHIRSFQESDGGPYYCRGKLGDKTGWKLKSIILYIGKILFLHVLGSNSSINLLSTHGTAYRKRHHETNCDLSHFIEAHA